MDLSSLGITRGDIDRVSAAPSIEDAKACLEALKAQARKNLRKLALELHPDRNGDDPAKTDQLKQLTSLLAKFTAVRVELAPPRPRVVHVYVQQGSNTCWSNVHGSASTTTYTSSR